VGDNDGLALTPKETPRTNADSPVEAALKLLQTEEQRRELLAHLLQMSQMVTRGQAKPKPFFSPSCWILPMSPLSCVSNVRALLVYPRIRLARNQLGRILRYTTRFHKAGGPRITVGIQNCDVPRDKAAIMAQGWPSEKGGSWYRVELLETCVECGEGHYWLSADDPAIETGYPRLVCDHCPAMIENLLLTKSALTQNAPDLLIITDISLSQWLTRQKYSHLWGLWKGERWVAPRFLVLDGRGSPLRAPQRCPYRSFNQALPSPRAPCL
jgi:ATP-dependent helicase YprA (DUF1998 family)